MRRWIEDAGFRETTVLGSVCLWISVSTARCHHIIFSQVLGRCESVGNATTLSHSPVSLGLALLERCAGIPIPWGN